MESIRTVHARPDGLHVVNLGGNDEVAVSLDPSAGDPNAALLRIWLRGNSAAAWVYTLDQQKAAALASARKTAAQVRQQIAGAATTERALSWILKAMFAAIWQVNDLDTIPLLKPLSDVAIQGFGIETELTGEDAKAIRDRSVEKAGAFFLALQLVEGMERMAEREITAALTLEALTNTITQLRTLEAQALEKLAALNKGGTNDV